MVHPTATLACPTPESESRPSDKRADDSSFFINGSFGLETDNEWVLRGLCNFRSPGPLRKGPAIELRRDVPLGKRLKT